MSFGSGGFGGFGQQNNQSSGFGGFGQNNNNTTSGFGTGTTGGFGQSSNTTGGGLFGGSSSNTGGGFGQSTGGFGASNTNTTSAFGSKPAFGSSTTGGGGLFGSNTGTNTGTTGFGSGGFGSTTNTTNTTPAFGSGTSGGGGLFGSSATATTPAFGSTGTTGGSLFGGGNTGTSGTGFGAGGFGASNNPGIGGAGDPPGTAVTPFQAHTEKEPNNPSQSNSFQNILFQDAYKKWSADELRLADYVAGRRYGNGTGGGAFGVSSNFGSGGFGTTNTSSGGGLFGASNNAATGNTTGGGLFGSSNTNTNTGTGFGQSTGTGFGSNTGTTGGGLFGSKPAGGGLFGGNQNQQSTGFGTNTGGGFGAGTNTNTGTGFGSSNTGGGGLFGSSNQQNKPAGGLFGNTSTTTNTGFGAAGNTGFGASNTNTTGGGLFGNTGNTNQQSTGGGLFGSGTNTNQQQQGTGGGLFGGQQNQNQQSGGGLFGNTQQKPGGLFGSSTQNPTTGGGLFGGANNQQQQQSTGFGTNTASTGGGLFGNKPAGGGLFGGSTQQSNTTGGGLFGNTSTQQNTQQGGTGLFGASNNQQQKPGGLFGSSTQNTGSGLFGGQNNQNQGGSLFGGSTNQQQQNQGLGNSLLGNSQQPNNAPQGLTAGLNDVSAYGSPSLFSSLGGNEVANPGPLATPLGGNAKPKRGAILPMYKLAPSSASRMGTPQKRGFGFSYSTYGGSSHGSPASSIASTPGTNGRSLLASSSSGSLSKSMSTNNLRRNFNTEDSILVPGAFSASTAPRWYGSTGSKKLVISRDMRSDLFSTPQKDKQIADSSSTSRKLSKRVSFDTSNVEDEEQPQIRGALPAPDGSPSTQADETPRQNRSAIGSNGSLTPEGESTSSLAGVQEEDNLATPGRQLSVLGDTAPGKYWTQPPLEELQSMNRVQRQKVDNFVIGRDNVGSIAFLLPVDLSGIELDDLFKDIVHLEPRSATVYPVTAKKPPVGKGLNVPARITLEQSWPRSGRDKRITNDPKKFNRHVERLKRIEDTEFVSYDKDTGVWVFTVEHFTTYGLDDSDEDSDEEMGTVGQPAPEPILTQSQQMALDASPGSSMEDTFHFRRSIGLPGAFDEQEAVIEDVIPREESFLGVSSADSAPNDVRLSLVDEQADDMGGEYDLSDEEDMTRSPAEQHHAAEHDDFSSDDGQDIQRSTPGGVLRARMRALKESAGPVQLVVADGDDWTEMLRKTVSPMKRDRQLLKELNEASPSRQNGQRIDFDSNEQTDLRKSSVWRKSTTEKKDGFANGAQAGLDKGRGFATSIDLMNSLFERPKAAPQNLRASASASRGFPKWPYERQEKVLSIDQGEKAFHDAGRPTWGPDETLVVTRAVDSQHRRSSREPPDILSLQSSAVQTGRQSVRLGKFSTESSKKYLRTQDSLTEIRLVDGVPVAALRVQNVQDVFHHQDMNDPASIHEKRVWELASILFDGDEDVMAAARKARLSAFWTELVDQASATSIGLAGTSEEKAVACLAGHRITEACKHLMQGKNFRLATLVPLIGTSDTAKKDMREQVKAWQDSKILSEFSEPIRAIYELLSGNVCVCEGMKGVPVEDRMESFVISKKFGLDWKQAFGLRLWYAISQQDDLAAAVNKFQEDIDQDRENTPQPWYQEQGIKPLWFDYEAHHRQDLLWGLLQLYAGKNADLEAVLRPENSQLSPLDMRVCWQLGIALKATGKVTFGENAQEKADAATIAYAAQLSSAGEWLEATFVLLHLSRQSARAKAIQDHLCRHAGLIGPESGPTFASLTEKFQIPATWVWEALALYMRGVKKDPAAEVQCLLKAGSFVEAHRVLAQQVAPQAIIERGHAELLSLMSQFQGHQGLIPDWSQGGEVYSHFLTMLQHRNRGEVAPRAVLDRLLAGLNSMNEQILEGEIIRYAALSDMADETAREIVKWTRKKQDVEFRSRILKLPLTQDRLLAYSVDLGMERYREVMSH